MKIMALLIPTLFILGCSNNVQPDRMSSFNVQKYPAWIKNPNIGVKIGAVGSASYQKNKSIQRKIALAKARAVLSEVIKVNVETEIVLKEKTINDNYDSSVKSSTILKSNNLIENAYIKDEFIDAENRLYIWLVM